MVNDFSVALYSTEGRGAFVYDQCPDLAPRLEAQTVPISVDVSGLATVEAMTVMHDRDAGPVEAPVIVSSGSISRNSPTRSRNEGRSKLSRNPKRLFTSSGDSDECNFG